MYSTTILALVASLSALTSAHMILKSPIPWGNETIDNSPLDNAFPGNYPCKQRTAVYALPSSGYNAFAVGSKQMVSFDGSATHGGGSCQLSITTDLHPTATSTFKVIYSVVGGCPLEPFTITVPSGIPNGIYRLAWTWYNKVGNRELYMNCAPIHVTGGADHLDVFNTLPDMYTINLPNSGCASEDSMDLVFPSPGAYKSTSANSALATQGPEDKGGCKAQINIGAGSGIVTMPARVSDGGAGTGSGTSPTMIASGTAPTLTTAESSAKPTYTVTLPSTFVTSYVASSAVLGYHDRKSMTSKSPTAYPLPTQYPFHPSSPPASSPSSSTTFPDSAATTVQMTTIVQVTTTVAPTSTTASLTSASSGSTKAVSSISTTSTVLPTDGVPPPATQESPYTIISGTASAVLVRPQPASSSSVPSAYQYPSIQAPSTSSPTAPPGSSSSAGSSSSSSAGSSSGSGSSSSSGTDSATTKCTTEGALLCNTSGTQFGLCDHGKVVWQDVAGGTRCVGGQIV